MRFFRKTGRIIVLFSLVLALCISSMMLMSPSVHAQTDSAVNTSGDNGIDNSSTEIDEAVDNVEGNLKSSDANAVADNIKTILNASSQISGASKDQLSDMQTAIDEVTDQYNSLSDEDKNTLSQSKELLNNAETAVDAMAESTDKAEISGTVNIKQTGEENSFRYINGVNINDAVNIVEQEQKAVSSDDSTDNSTSNDSTSDVAAPDGSASDDSTSDGSVPDGSAPDASAPNASAPDVSAPDASDTPNTSDSTDNSGITGTSAVLNQSAYNILLTSDDSGSSGAVIETAAASSISHKGIDVSRHNGTIDWAKVKQSGIEFAIIRCGYGSDDSSQDDSKWEYNVAQCEKYGIPYGVYLYSYATSISQIESEAQHAIRLLSGHHPALPVYIDIEENEQFALGANTLSSFAKRFCDVIDSVGYKAGLYASASKWEEYFGTFAALPNYYHWIAQWSGSCTYSQRYEAWQYSSDGSVAGVPTRVDLDLWYGALGSQSKSPDSSDGTNPNIVQDGTYYIANFTNQNLVLDVASGSKTNGANVQLYTLNRTGAQKFTLQYLNNGYYRITNVNSGKVLDVNGASARDGVNVQQYDSNNSYAQQWKIKENSDGSLILICRASGDVLDINGGALKNGTNVQQYMLNGSAAQKFTLLPSDNSSSTDSAKTVSDGTYYIANFSHQNMVLDVASASTANLANVQLYGLNRTAAQKYTLQYLNNGYYRITNVNSGRVLDVSGASVKNGANVQQCNSNNTYAQQWKISKNSDGSLTFTCRASGKVLDINGGSFQNGTNIQQYTSNGTAAQKFTLLSVNGASDNDSAKVVSDGTYYIANFTSQNLVIDVVSASKANAANVQLYSLNRTKAQQFTLKYLNNGYYRITNVNSGKVLNVRGASTINGANVEQCDSNNTYAQQWKITKNDDGSLTFKCRASGKVLDVYGGILQSGSNIQQYASNGTAAQKFTLLSI